MYSDDRFHNFMFIMKTTTTNDFIVSAIESIHFSETETLAKTEVSRRETSEDNFGFGPDKARLRHSENVPKLETLPRRRCKTRDEPKPI